MARYTGPVCRICRRHGLKLFLKGERCFGPKCAIERRNFPPGDGSYRGRVDKKKKTLRNYYSLELFLSPVLHLFHWSFLSSFR